MTIPRLTMQTGIALFLGSTILLPANSMRAQQYFNKTAEDSYTVASNGYLSSGSSARPDPRKELATVAVDENATKAPLPIIVTEAPITGNSAKTFFVFLPVANVGKGTATGIRLTSVELTFLGMTAGATTLPATLPFVPGSGYLGPGGVRSLDLEFDNSGLVSGNTYIVKVSGTYEVTGTTYKFELNRPVIYAKGFSATHAQVMDTTLAKFQALPGLKPQVDDEAMVAFLGGLPQVSTVVADSKSLTISITFKDGWQPLLLLNNFIPPSRPVLNDPTVAGPAPDLSRETSPSTDLMQPNTADTAAGPPVELPKSNQVRVLNAFGSGIATAVSPLASWLAANGYKPVAGADASVQGLRNNVANDGVFYISSHGGGGSTFVLWTVTPYNQDCEPENLSNSHCPDPKLVDDIRNGRVITVGAQDHWNPDTNEYTKVKQYGITSAFIEKWWGSFGDNALVYIDTCDSIEGPGAESFRAELFAKGASLYVGWTGEVHTDVLKDTAELVFDRLLGANEYCPEDGLSCHMNPSIPPVFAQRPFDYTQVEKDLPYHGLGKDDSGTFGSQIRFEPNPQNPAFGLLAPSISHLEMDELKEHLTIYGIFGHDPRLRGSDSSGSVTIGGTAVNGGPEVKGAAEADIVTWAANQIVVKLPRSGAGSSGNVQVAVRGHKSNVAQLTEWRGKEYTFTISGEGTLHQRQDYSLHLRADVRRWREAIHNPPPEPTGSVYSANDSTGAFASSGTDQGSFESFSWSGSGKLMNAAEGVRDNYLLLGASIDNSKQWKVNLPALATTGLSCKVCVLINGNQCYTTKLPVFGPSQFFSNNNAGPSYFTFSLDDKSGIEKGSLSANVGICDAAAGKGKFEWGPVPATEDTAPNPESAR